MSLILSVPSINQEQEKEFWCWAATAANVYNSMGGPPKSQCDVVSLVQVNCTNNDPDALSSALAKLGISDGRLLGPSFDLLQSELGGLRDSLKEPVCGAMLFPGNATHFVAVFACDEDTEHVWVADPWVGGPLIEMSYMDFEQNYSFVPPELQTATTAHATLQQLARVRNMAVPPPTVRPTVSTETPKG